MKSLYFDDFVFRFGHGKASLWLMKRGADLNARDATGRTPLITAVAAGNFHIVDVGKFAFFLDVLLCFVAVSSG